MLAVVTEEKLQGDIREMAYPYLHCDTAVAFYTLSALLLTTFYEIMCYSLRFQEAHIALLSRKATLRGIAFRSQF